MIISASRRTDIPAFYSEWLINRLQAGFALVRNPHNPHHITHVSLNPDIVDCIVFWTKNPRPMLRRLTSLDSLGYRYYFQFTVTPYGQAVEKGLPAKMQIMETFKKLSDKIGPDRVVWRYDPVIISQEYSCQYHIQAFNNLSAALSGYTTKCIFSFLDLYAKVRTNMNAIGASVIDDGTRSRLAQDLAAIAQSYNLKLQSCSEQLDLSTLGIAPAACIDRKLLESLLGASIRAKKDPNQRPGCHCIESIDLGAYDCCAHNCTYCYATTSQKLVAGNMRRHNPSSPLLIGVPSGDETITSKAASSLLVKQTSLF